ncbi:FAD-dependent oxidoreductase [Chloroflexota bacterium]
MDNFQKLFEPGRIGKMDINNRILMSPMGNQLWKDGFVTDRLKDYFEARAKGGVGMVMTDPLKVTWPVGAGHKDTGLIVDDKFILGLSELVQVIHQQGVKIAAQLGHMGPADAFPVTETLLQPVAASTIGEPPDYTHPASSIVRYSLPREMSVGEIVDVVAAFAKGAERVQKAGFDAIEINAHTRYLINSFLSPAWNRRKDEYGGDLRNRARFLLEIVSTIKEAVGHDYPLLCRINGEERNIIGGITIEMAKEFALMLENAGVDAIDVSGMWPHIPSDPPGFNVNAASAIKKVVSIPVLVSGRLSPELGERLLRHKKADFIVIGRPLIADPELPNKAASGRLDDITPCLYCDSCLALDRDCAVNAARGREREYEIKPAEKTKKVLVVGGGPGGMEAARVAALRGHQVVLYEKENKLGGQLILASILRKENEALIKYLTTQMRKLGVKVELGKEVAPALIAEIKPDAIVLATGATSSLPEIPGINRDNVLSGADIQEMMHSRLRRDGRNKRGSRRRVIWYLGCILMRAPFGQSVMRQLLRFWTPFGKRVVVVGGGGATWY